MCKLRILPFPALISLLVFTNFIIVLQLGHATDDLTVLTTKTVVDPMKKLNGEFASVALALKKRDTALR